MARQSYRSIKKARRRRRKLVKYFFPASAIIIFFAAAIIYLNGGFEFRPETSALYLPDAQSITIEIRDDREGYIHIFSRPLAHESHLIGKISSGALLTFYGRHQEEGWYLTSWKRKPAWTYVELPNLKVTLSHLPVLTEAAAATYFVATPQAPTR